MLTKEALEKVAAADARDQAAAIEFGFEEACADMGLDRPRAEGLAKVARARLAEFKKLAAETTGADVAQGFRTAVHNFGNNVNRNLLRPVTKHVNKGIEATSDVVGDSLAGLGRAIRPALGNAGKALIRGGENVRGWSPGKKSDFATWRRNI